MNGEPGLGATINKGQQKDADSLHWSDEEDELYDKQGITPTLLELREQIAEYNNILHSIEYQETSDLNRPLASRAHLEKLIDQYWDLCVRIDDEQEDASQEDDDTVAHSKEVAGKFKELIQNHPQFRSSPLLLRWPLLAADVPKPMWTLADEMVAVMERHKQLSINHNTLDDDRTDFVAHSLAIPAVTTCQHVLLSLLQDLSTTASLQDVPRERQDARRDISIHWRSVLDCISMRNDVPEQVKLNIRKRLEEIYGNVTYATPPFWMANVGIGGNDKVGRLLKEEDIQAPKQWYQPSRSGHDIPSTGNNLQAELDEVLLRPNGKKSPHYLQPPPRTQRRLRIEAERKAKERKRQRRNDSALSPTDATET